MGARWRQWAYMGWLVWGLGAVFYSYEYLLRVAPGVMTQDLMAYYAVTADGLSQLNVYYYLAYTPMQFLVGLFMDRYGPRRLLVLACGCCALGAWLFVTAETWWLAKVSRFVMGFGSAFAFVGALKLASVWLPARRFALVAGLTSTLGMLGGDVVVTALVDTVGWRHALWTTVGIGTVLTLLIWVVVCNGTGYAQRAINWRQTLKGFAYLATHRQIWINGCIGGLLYLPMSAFAELWGAPFFQEAVGFTRHQATVAISVIFVGWALGAPLMGWISDKLGVRRGVLILCALVVTVLFSVLLYVPQTNHWIIYTLLLLLGIFTSAQVLVFAVGYDIADKSLAGVAISITNMLVMLFPPLVQRVIGLVLDSHWHGSASDVVRIYSRSDFQTALTILPVCFLVTALLALFLSDTREKA